MEKINKVFADLIKERGSQVKAANDLGISSQRVGYYIRGRAIPTDVIVAWRKAYNEDLLKLAETHETKNVSRETLKQKFHKEVETDVLTLELWQQVQKDTEKKDREIDRLWNLIGRLELPGDAIKGVPTDNS